ncbi:MAG: apolipoprotein N-acyltransferase [Sedimentisphaerales bacterium]|nr:apolipoprotein N-acyltransferase [Sedimentisphaerales bacterium]
MRHRIGNRSGLLRRGRLKSALRLPGQAVRKALPVSPLFAVSAVFLTVIQPPFNWGFLAWAAYVPFALACSPRGKAGPRALAAYLVSVLYWMGNLYWMVPVTVIGWVVFCLYTALLWPVLALGIRWCRGKGIPLFLALPVFIVGIEQMQGLFLGGFLWRLLGHSQYRNITIIQIADIFGAGGVSFLVGMVNGLIAELILGRQSGLARTTGALSRNSVRIRQLGKGIIVGGVVAGAVFYGRWRIAQTEDSVSPGPVVASLQSNVPQSVKREFKQETSRKIFDDLMVHSKVASKAGAEFIVWPETMVQATLNEEVLGILEPSHPWKVLDKALSEHSREGAFVLVGAYGGVANEAGTDLVEEYNSAFLYQPDGKKYPQHYDKIHLVPFGEVLPFRKSLPWLYNILMKFTPYDGDYSLDYGSKYTVFEMAGKQGQPYRFAVIICYEDVVPYISRNFAIDKQGNKQVDWLVNISNDGWFVRFDENSRQVHPSTELPQHAAICVFRAVENRLGIVRSVNTGISCLIDSAGRIGNNHIAGTLPSKAMSRTGMAGWFADKMPIDKRITFFSKYGQWLDSCCKICVFLFVIASILARLPGTRLFGTGFSGRSNERRVHRV